MGLDRTSVRAGMSILGCSVVVVVSGITLAFNVFAKALKDSFQLSQVEVAFLASATCIGHNIVLPAGCFNDRLGPRWSMLPGCVFTCLGWGTVLITLLERDKLGHDFIITVLSIALFTAGHGRTYFFLTGISTVIRNVPEKLRPAVLSSMEILCGVIPLVYPIVFGGSLQGDHSYISFAAFLSCSLGLSLAGGIFGSIFMTPKAVLMDENSNMPLTSRNDGKGEDCRLIEETEQTKMDCGTAKEKRFLCKLDSKKSRSVLLSLDYQLIFWTATTLTAIALFYDYNTVFLLMAVGHKMEYVNLITLYRGTNTSTRFIVSLCLYLFKTIRGIPYVLPVLCALFAIIFALLVMFLSQYVWCLQLAYAVLGSMCGMVFVFPVVLICDMYGPKNFGRNFGLLNSTIPILMLILNVIFSYIYDSQIEDQGSWYCYGKRCFTFPFITTLVLSIVCTILSPIIYFRRRQFWKSVEHLSLTYH